MNRRDFPIGGLNSHLHLVAGNFPGNGAAAPAASTYADCPDIKSITWAATGLYTVELVDKWPKVISITTSVQDATPDNNGIAAIVSETIAMDGKFVLQYRVNNVATNLDSAAKIHFKALLRNRS